MALNLDDVVAVDVTQFFGEPEEQRTIRLGQPSQFRELLACFPGLGERLDPHCTGAWMAGVKLVIHTRQGAPFEIWVSYDYRHWDDGGGNRAAPRRLRPVIDGLFKSTNY